MVMAYGRNGRGGFELAGSRGMFHIVLFIYGILGIGLYERERERDCLLTWGSDVGAKLHGIALAAYTHCSTFFLPPFTDSLIAIRVR